MSAGHDEHFIELEGGPIDPDLDALENAVMALRMTRFGAWHYDPAAVETNHPPAGVLDGFAKAEFHLIEVIATLGANLAADQYLRTEGPS